MDPFASRLNLCLPLLFAVSGCAHLHRISPEAASKSVRVGIGSSEVTKGDRLEIYVRSCRKATVPARINPMKVDRCQDKLVGYAVVTEVIDETNALAEPLDGLELKSGMIAEKAL